MTSSRSKLEFPRLSATIRIESGATNEVFKSATLTLFRNEFRDLMLRLESSKASRQYPILPDCITFHKRFAAEGKATLKLGNLKCLLYVSNAPPRQLILFLKALASKLLVPKAPSTPKSSRERILASVLPSALTDISPITLQEAQNLKNSGSSLPGATPDTPKTTRKRKMTPLILTPEQKEVLSAVQSGVSLFFTGGAGTGKSFLIKKIIGSLPPESTFVTASTGVAAHLIGGVTLHSFAGIAQFSEDIPKVAMQADKKKGSVWRKCKVLIIDEISMVDGRYFSTLEAAARYIRNNDKPFGGIQLLLTGDFLQLPPVNVGGRSMFCFESPAWRSCIQKVIELRTVKRQSDPGFISLLNNLRFGKCNGLMTKTLVDSGNKTLQTEDGICATRLCTHSADVDTINKTELGKLKTTRRVFKAEDSGSSSTLGGIVDKEIELKIGAQVMLTKNISVPEGLVNGARGIVTRFEAQSGHPVVQFKSCGEKTVGFEKWNYRCSRTGALQTRSQVPLRLAWAFSIHKSQGLTLDFVQVSLSKVFEAGQAYVALSRAKDLNSLRVLHFHPSCVRADPRVIKFYRNIELMTPMPL